MWDSAATLLFENTYTQAPGLNIFFGWFQSGLTQEPLMNDYTMISLM